jgi:lipopolysaccharide export system permease protein
MKIIYKYLLRDFFKFLALCLGILIFSYIIINLFDNLGKFLAKNVQFVDIMLHYVYLIPSYIVLLLPIASIMAIFFIFGIMTKNKELIALKTCGLNVNSLFNVIIVTGFVIALFTFIFQEIVVVRAQTQWYEHKQTKIDKRPAKSQNLRRNLFYHGENNWVYYTRKFDAERQRMDVLTLWKVSPENTIIARIDAGAAEYDSAWTLYNATVRHFDSLGNETIETHEKIPMPELKETPQDFLKRMKQLEEMNVLEIFAFVGKQGRAGQDITAEAVELNDRFSYPLITIIVLLMTLPLSVVLKRGGIAIGLGISIVIAFLYWGAIQSCRAYGVAGIMSPFLAAWLPNIVFGAIGIVLIFKVPR